MYSHVDKYANVNNWNRYDEIILFDAVFLVPAIYKAKRRECKLHLWMWNIIEDYNVGWIQIAKEFADVWTFDKGDADNYGLHFSNQFYFPQSTEEVLNQNSKSVFFVGADKNRMKSLCYIADDLHSIGFQGDFYILPDANKGYSQKDKQYLLKDRMDDESVIDHVRKCAAVLDLVKEGQVGITVRTLEAVFYKKKVITNNIAVRNTDLYRFGNIYILGKESVTLEDFLRKPFANYGQCILKKYTAKTWLKNICSGEESILDNDKDEQYTDKQASRYTIVAA